MTMKINKPAKSKLIKNWILPSRSVTGSHWGHINSDCLPFSTFLLTGAFSLTIQKCLVMRTCKTLRFQQFSFRNSTNKVCKTIVCICSEYGCDETQGNSLSKKKRFSISAHTQFSLATCLVCKLSKCVYSLAVFTQMKRKISNCIFTDESRWSVFESWCENV